MSFLDFRPDGRVGGFLMALRKILILPDPILRQVCRPVLSVDEEIRRLADDMLETMYAAPGVGLAASQIGILKRVLVLDVAPKEAEPEPMVVINPEIVESSEEVQLHEEGCLSIPEYYEEVARPARITVTFLDRDGQACICRAEGLLAVCLQHEIDHLNGVLFIDHLSKLKRGRILTKFKKRAASRKKEEREVPRGEEVCSEEQERF